MQFFPRCANGYLRHCADDTDNAKDTIPSCTDSLTLQASAD